MNDSDVKKIIQEYSENYCSFLEAAYGANMMSEGGEQAIERMMSDDVIQDKKLLEIGFGLGGSAFYLSDKYNAEVYGIEINPWMVNEASKRTPVHLKSKVSFHLYHPDAELAFPDNCFDIVFSKGVLTHLNKKSNLFKEVYRVLRPKGSFLIDDWLSPQKGCWGERLKKVCDIEGLTLYAETESSYRALLQRSGFSKIEMRDENENYHQYNVEIVSKLKNEKEQNLNNPAFHEFSVDDTIEAYQLVADSIRDEELLIRWLRAVK